MTFMPKKKGMIPQYELEALAEVLYPTLKEYLESPEGKAAFEKWKKLQKPQGSDNKKTDEG